MLNNTVLSRSPWRMKTLRTLDNKNYKWAIICLFAREYFFNHGSRDEELSFITRKITMAVAKNQGRTFWDYETWKYGLKKRLGTFQGLYKSNVAYAFSRINWYHVIATNRHPNCSWIWKQYSDKFGIDEIEANVERQKINKGKAEVIYRATESKHWLEERNICRSCKPRW